MMRYPKCCFCRRVTTTWDESMEFRLSEETSIFCSLGSKRICVICASDIHKLVEGSCHQPDPKKPTKAPIPKKLRWDVWNRDNFSCKKCGKKEDLSIDHIHPEVLGGPMEMENLQTLCLTCNISKGARV